jgi:hypothetical protein
VHELRHAVDRIEPGHFGNALKIAGAHIAGGKGAVLAVDLEVLPFREELEIEGGGILAIARQRHAEIAVAVVLKAMVVAMIQHDGAHLALDLRDPCGVGIEVIFQRRDDQPPLGDLMAEGGAQHGFAFVIGERIARIARSMGRSHQHDQAVDPLQRMADDMFMADVQGLKASDEDAEVDAHIRGSLERSGEADSRLAVVTFYALDIYPVKI